MKLLTTLTLSLLFCFQSFASDASPIAYQLNTVENGIVIVEKCTAGECVQIGNPEGYDLDELRLTKNHGKLIAVGVAATEVAVTVVALSMTGMYGSFYAFAEGMSGNSFKAFAAMAASVVIPLAISGVVVTVIDPINPVSIWKRAEIRDNLDISDLDLEKGEAYVLDLFRIPRRAAAFERNLLKVLKKAAI